MLSPPCAGTMSRAIVRPRPVPPVESLENGRNYACADQPECWDQAVVHRDEHQWPCGIAATTTRWAWRRALSTSWRSRVAHPMARSYWCMSVAGTSTSTAAPARRAPAATSSRTADRSTGSACSAPRRAGMREAADHPLHLLDISGHLGDVLMQFRARGHHFQRKSPAGSAGVRSRSAIRRLNISVCLHQEAACVPASGVEGRCRTPHPLSRLRA